MDIKWEKTKGPTTTTYQTVYSGWKSDGSYDSVSIQKIESSEDIEYPVFNG
jgi:hypothetical protein